MKTDTVFKRAFNRLATMLSNRDFGDLLPSENELSRRIGVSRTTIRKVLRELISRGMVVQVDALRRPGRPAEEHDYYPASETTPRSKHVEQEFREWMLRGGATPGTTINELELARQFDVATNSVREFLLRFSRFGLIEKRSNSGWLFKGFTESFALELFEIRMMFELRSARLFAKQPSTSAFWSRLERIKASHQELLNDIDARFHDFSALDDKFHRLINEVSPNRFINDFYDIISFIFHYHYQWNKQDERQRNQAAIVEHLAYIDALVSRDIRMIEIACRKHLSSARATLINSIVDP